MSKLRTKTVQRAMDAIARSLRADGRVISAGTLHRIRAVLRSALSEARRHGLIGFNPAWRLRPPNGARPPAVVWDDVREAEWRRTGIRPTVAVWNVEHAVRFLQGAQHDPLFALWRLLVLQDLRHGAASLAGAAGVSLKVIQHDIGHSSCVTTADTYWSPFRQMGHAAVAATAELLLSHARRWINLEGASQA